MLAFQSIVLHVKRSEDCVWYLADSEHDSLTTANRNTSRQVRKIYCTLATVLLLGTSVLKCSL